MNTEKTSDNSLWDLNLLLSRKNIAEDFLPLLMKTFFQEVPKLLNDINNSLEKGDKELLKQLCHKLKGMSINVGAHSLSEMARKIEEELPKDDPPTIRLAVKEIKSTFERSIEEFEAIKKEGLLD